MKHVAKTAAMAEPKCGAALGADDKLVTAALQSDCDDCRTALGVGRIGEKLWSGAVIGVSPELAYDPDPYPNIEPLEDILKRRDGR